MLFNNYNSFAHDYVYMLKTIKDFNDLNIKNDEVKNLLENCFVSGISEVNIIFSKIDGVYESIEKLLLNSKIKYLVIDFLKNNDYENYFSLNNFLKNKNLISAFIASKNIDGINKDIDRLIFYDLESGDENKFLSSLASIASTIASLNNIEAFRYKKISGEHDGFLLSTESCVKLSKREEDFYINRINFLSGESLESLIKKEYVIGFIKKRLIKSFKNRVNTKTKLDAIKCQTYIILKDFFKNNIIETFQIPIVYIENKQAMVEVNFIIKDYLKSIEIKTNIAV